MSNFNKHSHKKNVQECLSKGLAVIEGDAEKDLINYPNQSFDIAILNQATYNGMIGAAKKDGVINLNKLMNG